jgi:hypothetical protein
LCRGEPTAFEVVYERHCDAAFSLAYRMCGKRAIADVDVEVTKAPACSPAAPLPPGC